MSSIFSPVKSFLKKATRKHTSVAMFAVGMPLAVIAGQCAGLGEQFNIPAAPAFDAQELQQQTVRVALVSSDSCSGLLDRIKEEALDRVGPYGLDGDDYWYGFPEPRIALESDDFAADSAVAGGTPTAAAAPPAGGDGGGAGGPDFSNTNVQVEGVDEADIVKTNGDHIFGVSESGREFWVVRADSDDPTLVGRLSLGSNDYYSEMFLVGDRAFLIGTPGDDFIAEPYAFIDEDAAADSAVSTSSSAASSAASADIAEPDIAFTSVPYGYYRPRTLVTEIDLSDLTDPEAVRHMTIDGYYVSSRLAGGQVRLIVNFDPSNDLPFVSPRNDSPAARAAAESANRAAVNNSVISDWLPTYSLSDHLGNQLDSGLWACDQVFVPEEFAGFAHTSVLSIDASENLGFGDAVSVLASGSVVYATAESLYVSHVVRDFGFVPFNRRPSDLKEETVIHKFSLRADGTARYEASGAIAGFPLNQFAFHEYDGHLFVATTISPSREDSESFITSLRESGRTLRVVDSVGNLGRTELIYAVRYLADTAYVVTFRQIDPLYVVNLANPADLIVEGELKITGYSSYLHPLGNDLLLGVGQEATDRGRTIGVKVSLFDVSVPANPRVLDDIVIEDAYSAAEYNHKAFLWWAPEQLAVIPISEFYPSDFEGALAIRVVERNGRHSLELDSRVSHFFDQTLTGSRDGCDWYKLPPSEFGRNYALGKICPQPLESEYGESPQGAPDHYNCYAGDGFEYLSEPEVLDNLNIEPLQSSEQSQGLLPTEDFLAAVDGLDKSDFSRVSICYGPQAYQRILRSLVIGENLWTVSSRMVQVNDLAQLAVEGNTRVPN